MATAFSIELSNHPEAHRGFGPRAMPQDKFCRFLRFLSVILVLPPNESRTPPKTVRDMR